MVSQRVTLALCAAVALASAAYVAAEAYPPPYYRLLVLQTPPLTGTDVVVTQHLVVRDAAVGAGLPMTGAYDAATVAAVKKFQAAHGLQVDGEVGPITATLLLQLHSADGYKDDGKPAADRGYLYKMHVPVHKNRSIEVMGTLYSANNTELFKFRVRAHGHDKSGSNAWPHWNSSGDGLTMFAGDGNTPTGLMSFDLNSPEPLPKLFGPYPINRAVLGLEGNAVWMLPHIRNGILMHTGEWPGWAPPAPMPNSDGCIHAWPASIHEVWQLLVAEGVKVRPNPFGVLPYPYKPQGLLSVEVVDD